MLELSPLKNKSTGCEWFIEPPPCWKEKTSNKHQKTTQNNKQIQKQKQNKKLLVTFFLLLKRDDFIPCSQLTFKQTEQVWTQLSWTELNKNSQLLQHRHTWPQSERGMSCCEVLSHPAPACVAGGTWRKTWKHQISVRYCNTKDSIVSALQKQHDLSLWSQC